ncbi:hypothetical protein [Rhizobium sp. TRM95796]|uniref:hypothetical protein n=1 Tax=Rhizobium sp. TRM95796 TaxID=2979862 RepID=UPI0021E9679C|nr:hypothetical protein [Rhizobium sp. TRM95796]MCV3766620.1 hypothetical protein [Rhizobium sp. TRM95796]
MLTKTSGPEEEQAATKRTAKFQVRNVETVDAEQSAQDSLKRFPRINAALAK